jgi:hypothetical protein
MTRATCKRGKDLKDSGSNTGKGGNELGRNGPRPVGPARFEAQSAPL